ncbi:MAG: hypothetical protein QW607_05710 [Desulfurococcaceae archaeon]
MQSQKEKKVDVKGFPIGTKIIVKTDKEEKTYEVTDKGVVEK